MNLFTQREDGKRASVDRTADTIKQRFGRAAIHRGAPRDKDDRRRDLLKSTRRKHDAGVDE